MNYEEGGAEKPRAKAFAIVYVPWSSPVFAMALDDASGGLMRG
jgi:hypothetical protein